MKKLKLIFALFTILLWSCNKTSLNEPELTNNPNQSEQPKMSGVLPDDPALLKHFEFRGSKEFIEKGNVVSFSKNNKKLLDATLEEADVQFESASKPGRGNGGGNTSGGSTGGGTTTTWTDATAPVIKSVTPAAGTSYTLANYGATTFTTSAWVYDNYNLKRVQIRLNNVVVLDSTQNLLPSGSNSAFQKTFGFIFGDGTYTISWQAWDAAGNTTIATTTMFYNSQPMTLPTNFPSSVLLPYPQLNKYIQQGGEGSCVGFAVGNAYTIQKYVRGGGTGGYNDNNVMSPEWVYNMSHPITWSCGSGTGVLSGMGLIANRGAATWSAIAYSDANGCDTSMMTDAIRANALSNKPINWGYMSSTADRNAIKYSIYQGFPAVFTFVTDASYRNAGPGFVWKGWDGTNGGPHAMTIIGFDDSKNAFLCLNSWGSSWGGNGCIWVDYEWLTQITGVVYMGPTAN